MKIPITSKETVEQTLRMARLFVEAYKRISDADLFQEWEYADLLLKQLDELQDYGYDTGKEVI